MSKYDSIVIGAGHNGLVCAALLARSGQRVALVESSDSVGGLAAGREFHPGFKVSVAHTVSHFPKAIVKALDLESHGLNPRPEVYPVTALDKDGHHVSLTESGLSGVGDKDLDSYSKYKKQMRKFATALEPFWLKTIPRIGPGKLGDLATFGHMGLNIRRMGKPDMREFLRMFSLPMRDVMDENFESELLKSMLAWDGMIGSRLAPRSPNNAVLTLLYRMAQTSISCKVSTLVSALESAALSAGVEILKEKNVERILVDAGSFGLQANGVKFFDGEQINSDRVISSVDPKKTFLNMLGVENLEIGFANRINRLRCNGLVAKLHLALSGMPTFSGVEHPQGRMIIAPELDAIEFAFDPAKYGEFSENPVMEINLPSIEDDTLAPAGQHVLSANVMFVPAELKGDWTDSAREILTGRIIDTIESYAPGIRSQVIAQELLTPADIEDRFGVTGGHWHQTEMALDQMLMMRPTYEAAQYATPVPGLFLCGAGSHPGGDLTGAPGYNAAREILK